MVHSCLQLRHEWCASFFDVGASLKNYSRRLQRTNSCESFGLRANKLLVGLEQILPHKKALLRAVPIELRYCLLWMVVFETCFDRTGLLPWKVCLYHYYTCVVVVYSCLQLRLIRHEWGTSFFDVGTCLKNCSHRLQRTKPCGSFSPRADKLLAGLEQILPHNCYSMHWCECRNYKLFYNRKVDIRRKNSLSLSLNFLYHLEFS